MPLRPARLFKAGLWAIGLGWAPVVVVGLMDPTTHPTGLALIAWAGTMLGCGLAAAAGGLWASNRLARRRRRTSRTSRSRR